MNDYWYRDMSGFGGGIEDIPVAAEAKLAIVLLGGSSDDLQSDGTVYPENQYVFNKVTADISLYWLKLLGGELGMNAVFSDFNGDSVITDEGTLRVLDSGGWSVGLFQVWPFAGMGQNKINLFYGTGAAENYKAIITGPLGLELTPNSTVQVEKFKRL